MFTRDLLADKHSRHRRRHGSWQEHVPTLPGTGASVVICGRRQNVLDETATEFANISLTGSHGTSAMIRDASQVEAMAETLWAARPLDALVNNAAGNFIARTEDAEPEGGRRS